MRRNPRITGYPLGARIQAETLQKANFAHLTFRTAASPAGPGAPRSAETPDAMPN
jgi:hypothetical protein